MVCVATGLAGVGVGGLAVGGKIFGSSAPIEVGSGTNPPLLYEASGVDNLLPSLIASGPGAPDSAPDTPFSHDWLEADQPRESPLPPDWSEIGNIPDISSPDTPGGPVEAPEPASISVMGAGLLGIATFGWRKARSGGSA